MSGRFGQIRPPKKRAFLVAYSRCGSIRRAAKLACVDRESHRHWMAKDEAYQAAFALAKEESIEYLEDAARRRALKTSDVLLMFLLKAARPEVYRERSSQDVNIQTGSRLRIIVDPEREEPPGPGQAEG